MNLAWLLASAGHRVLITDASDGLHRAADYLQHVAVETSQVTAVEGPGARVSGEWSRHDETSPDAYRAERRFLLPAGLGELDLVACASHELDGVLSRVRRSPRYDVIIVNHPTAGVVQAAGCGRWSDCVVICVRPFRDQVLHALSLRRAVWEQGSEPARVVLLACQVDPGTETEQRRATLGLVEADRHRADEPPTAVVAVPQRTFGLDGAVAALIDAPKDPHQLLGAYLDLVEVVLPGGPTPRPVPAPVRERYRGALQLQAPDPGRLGVVYLGRERSWADWVVGELKPYGVPTVLLPLGCDRRNAAGCTQFVVVVGEQGAALAAEVERLGAPAPDRLLSLLVSPSATGIGSSLTIRPVPGDPAAAAAALKAGLGWIPARQNTGSPAPLPGSGRLEAVLRPLRNEDFIGRDIDLDRLRDLLPMGSYSQVTICGPAGSGKSETACEFAHRFSDSYDVVWWIPAHSRATVRQGLAELARELKLDPGGDVPTAVHGALKEQSRRWLLIFDNAEEPQVFEDLIPLAGSAVGTGHMIVTCRRAGGDVVLPLGRFARRHTLDLLQKWLPELPTEDAEKVGELTGDLPIAVRLAVAWLKEETEAAEAEGASHSQAINSATEKYITDFGNLLAERERRPDETPEHHLTEIALRLTMATLRGLGSAAPARLMAVHLAELTAFLSPDGVSLALLSSARTLTELASFDDAAGRWLAEDGLLLHYALRVGNRHGLFELNRAGRSEVRMHRMLGESIRELMSDQERRDNQTRILRVLAAYAPTDAEGDAIGRPDNLKELAGHVVPSGAADSADPAVRRWLVLQVRHAYTDGDVATWEAMLGFGRRLRELWRRRILDGDPLYARLCVQLANIERAMGHIDAACLLDEEALAAQRRTLGANHPRTLLTARGLAADYRGLGRFHEAWAEDFSTHSGLVLALGRDHLETLRAAWDLALSWHLDGNAVQAVETSDQVLEQLWRLFPPDSPYLARAVVNHAMFLRELGRDGWAQEVLDLVRTRLRDGSGAYALDDLRLRDGYATCRRGLGFAPSARVEHEQVRAALIRRVGEDHPYTVAATVALSADLHVLGRHREAIDTVLSALDRLQASQPEEHPVVNLCQSNLALYHRAAGDTDQAVHVGRFAYGRLRDSLLEQHPWTLAAGLNFCGHLIAGGSRDEASGLRAQLAEWSQLFVSPSHPVSTKIARSLSDDEECLRSETLFEIPPP